MNENVPTIALCGGTEFGERECVDIYGTLRRHDPVTGALELTRTLESEHEHRCNVILPAGDDCVVGTPFISMNFWKIDARTGKGAYGGRVAGSFGQCDYAIKVGGKIYFAVYGGGQLTEYDPAKQTGFPRNPRLVALNSQGQHGAGITSDGCVVWIAFKPKYGTLDGAMIRFDTTTGAASYRNGAISGQSILNPIYNAGDGCLVAGTTYLSDCSTATPIHDRTYAVVLDSSTMDVVSKVPGPECVDTLINIGPLNSIRWLMQGGTRLFVFNTKEGVLVPYDRHPELPNGTVRIASAGEPGRFLIQIRESLQAWNAAADTFEPIANLADGFVGRWWVHGSDLTFDCGRYAALWHGYLSAARVGKQFV